MAVTTAAPAKPMPTAPPTLNGDDEEESTTSRSTPCACGGGSSSVVVGGPSPLSSKFVVGCSLLLAGDGVGGDGEASSLGVVSPWSTGLTNMLSEEPASQKNVSRRHVRYVTLCYRLTRCYLPWLGSTFSSTGGSQCPKRRPSPAVVVGKLHKRSSSSAICRVRQSPKPRCEDDDDEVVANVALMMAMMVL